MMRQENIEARDVFAAGHLGFALMALHFGVIVWTGGSPMTPEIYGPAVYAIPALTWSAAQFGAAALAAWGAWRKTRRGYVCMAIGSAMCAVIYSSLAAMSSLAATGTIVQAAAIWVATPFAIWSLFFALAGLRNDR